MRQTGLDGGSEYVRLTAEPRFEVKCGASLKFGGPGSTREHCGWYRRARREQGLESTVESGERREQRASDSRGLGPPFLSFPGRNLDATSLKGCLWGSAVPGHTTAGVWRFLSIGNACDRQASSYLSLSLALFCGETAGKLGRMTLACHTSFPAGYYFRMPSIAV